MGVFRIAGWWPRPAERPTRGLVLRALTWAMPTIAARLLDVMEHDILPLTDRGVSAGNKVFGAAVLRKADLSVVVAETNGETENPLWHGEVHTLKRFYELPERPAPGELAFLSTHEPCTMCMSAITWAGFDNFYYFFRSWGIAKLSRESS